MPESALCIAVCSSGSTGPLTSTEYPPVISIARLTPQLCHRGQRTNKARKKQKRKKRKGKTRDHVNLQLLAFWFLTTKDRFTPVPIVDTGGEMEDCRLKKRLSKLVICKDHADQGPRPQVTTRRLGVGLNVGRCCFVPRAFPKATHVQERGRARREGLDCSKWLKRAKMSRRHRAKWCHFHVWSAAPKDKTRNKTCCWEE